MTAQRSAALPPMKTHDDWPAYRAALIGQALTAVGGHLAIHPGGATLHHATGSSLRTYDIAATKSACADAGLPVIDTSALDLEASLLLIGLPMVAVGEPAGPQPWTSSPYVPLPHSAGLCRHAGAEVINMPLL